MVAQPLRKRVKEDEEDRNGDGMRADRAKMPKRVRAWPMGTDRWMCACVDGWMDRWIDATARLTCSVSLRL